MENIIAAEILCTKLQDSEKPLEIGIGMALRVVLDENIIIEERTQTLTLENSNLKEGNRRLVHKCMNFNRENRDLKEANRVMHVEIEQANQLIRLHKQLQDITKSTEEQIQRNKKLLRFPYLYGSTSSKSPKPHQSSIAFDHIDVVEANNSPFYVVGLKRAKRIWNVVDAKQKASINDFKLTSMHIVNWYTTFNLKFEEPLRYEHIKAACTPKCHGGLGTVVGMKLHDLLFKK